MKFTKEFKEKWINALRRGEYIQGTDFLENNGKYCCLGVAAHLCGIENIHRKKWIIESPNVPDILIGYQEFPEILSRMNDSGKTFEEIADWIETNVEVEE